MKNKFEIKIINDEQIEFWLNDIYISYANHDEDGWAGMDGKIRLIKSIAEILNAEFIETYPSYNEEDE